MAILEQINVIKVETAFTPPLILNEPFKPGPPSKLMNLLRPKITIGYKSNYLKDTKLAPYGEPVPNKWPTVQGVIVGVSILLFSLPIILFKRR